MRIAVVLGGVLSVATGAARADVIEIGDDGGVRTRSGGGDVQWIGDNGIAADAVMVADDAPAVPDAAVTEVSMPAVPDAWMPLLRRVADDYRVSPDLLAALVRQESGWHSGAISNKGAIGLAQLMPATARAMAIDARDPAANLAGGARYLRQMIDLFDGDIERALAAYNAGPGRVVRAGGVPRIAETQAYVSTILARLTPAPAVPKQDLIR